VGRVEFRRSELRHKGLQWATAFEAYLEALRLTQTIAVPPLATYLSLSQASVMLKTHARLTPTSSSPSRSIFRLASW
jgi:hypothetical protein